MSKQDSRIISSLPRGSLLTHCEHMLLRWYYSLQPISSISPPDILFAAPEHSHARGLCLFAHYDPEPRVDATVFNYLEDLKLCGLDIAFVSSAPAIGHDDQRKLRNVCTHILHRTNQGLDFASWKSAMLAIPNYKMAKQLVLANDSTYIIGSMKNVFTLMENESADFWGITESRELRPHLQSYFLCFNNDVIRHKAWDVFWKNLQAPDNKEQIIRLYETVLTQHLELAGFIPAAFAPRGAMPEGHESCRDNPTLAYGTRLSREYGVPIIKRALLRDNPARISLAGWDADLAPEKSTSIRTHMAKNGIPLLPLRPTPQTTILLPTCNGESFLPSLLDSCLMQPAAKMIVRDDASDDKTVEILKHYRGVCGDSIGLHLGKERLGVIKNVEFLLSLVESEYFLLADQDDIWEKDKIVLLWEAMQKLEEQLGADRPLLVYSDATLINIHGQQISSSYFASARISPRWAEEFRHSLVMSGIPGCTMMGNRALAKASVPFPADIIMHDWWLLLVAGGLGGVRAVNVPLVRYRQHHSNSLGADVWNAAAILKKLWCGPERAARNVKRTCLQAERFLHCYGKSLSEQNYKLCEAWASIQGASRWKRLGTIREFGFEKPGRFRNILFYLCGLY